jgi:SpoVK/Ycf46/Vps4 family AAA+-type ATPase
MENGLQNIFLEEMELLDGILIATTNLTCNMDKAFERRFLYKIEFTRPNADTRRQIWQSLLPSLSAKQAEYFAWNFELSGAQIDNVVRRAQVYFVLNNKNPSAEQLADWCMEDSNEK